MGTRAKPEPQRQVSAAVHHGSRRQWVTEQLLADALCGELPAGTHLVIHDLAERYAVSPTPIREALVALAGLGIVELEPNRGAVVRRLTAADVREISQVRQALECAAVRLACGRADLAELHRLLAECKRLAASKRPTARLLDAARQADNALHDLIAAASGNRHLARELERLKLLFRAGRDVAWAAQGRSGDYLRIVDEAREHVAILEALIAGDARGAARALAAHIRAGMKYWSRDLPDR
jgi:DNA-binding GntR family transcriptional regulator